MEQHDAQQLELVAQKADLARLRSEREQDRKELQIHQERQAAFEHAIMELEEANEKAANEEAASASADDESEEDAESSLRCNSEAITHLRAAVNAVIEKSLNRQFFQRSGGHADMSSLLEPDH